MQTSMWAHENSFGRQIVHYMLAEVGVRMNDQILLFRGVHRCSEHKYTPCQIERLQQFSHLIDKSVQKS